MTSVASGSGVGGASGAPTASTNGTTSSGFFSSLFSAVAEVEVPGDGRPRDANTEQVEGMTGGMGTNVNSWYSGRWVSGSDSDLKYCMNGSAMFGFAPRLDAERLVRRRKRREKRERAHERKPHKYAAPRENQELVLPFDVYDPLFDQSLYGGQLSEERRFGETISPSATFGASNEKMREPDRFDLDAPVIDIEASV